MVITPSDFTHHLEAFFPTPPAMYLMLLAFTTTLDLSDSVFTKATGCCRRLNSLETGVGVHTIVGFSAPTLSQNIPNLSCPFRRFQPKIRNRLDGVSGRGKGCHPPRSCSLACRFFVQSPHRNHTHLHAPLWQAAAKCANQHFTTLVLTAIHFLAQKNSSSAAPCTVIISRGKIVSKRLEAVRDSSTFALTGDYTKPSNQEFSILPFAVSRSRKLRRRCTCFFIAGCSSCQDVCWDFPLTSPVVPTSIYFYEAALSIPISRERLRPKNHCHSKR